MTTYEFPKSMQVAISFLSNFTEATKSWKNFIWFHNIAPCEIEKDEICFSEETASKYKKMQRRVFFYGYKNKLIARVLLEGNQFINSDHSKPTFWKVVEVHYVNNYDESSITTLPSWTRTKIEKKDQKLV